MGIVDYIEQKVTFGDNNFIIYFEPVVMNNTECQIAYSQYNSNTSIIFKTQREIDYEKEINKLKTIIENITKLNSDLHVQLAQANVSNSLAPMFWC